MIRKAALAASSLAIAGILALSPARAEAQSTVTCESRDYDRTYCGADTRGGVRLVRQLSEARCESGRTWGADRRGIWVARGCRAQFTLGGYDRDDRYGRDNRDDRYDRDDRRGRDNRSVRARAQQAERICRSAVGERYLDVRRADVDASYRGMDRAGNYVVRWNTDRAIGSCTVSSSGRVLDLRVTRR